MIWNWLYVAFQKQCLKNAEFERKVGICNKLENRIMQNEKKSSAHKQLHLEEI